jgi:F-type H+-transporting ATPase subunit delta
MAKIDDQELAIAGIYSEAMIRLARQKGEVDTLLQELMELASLLEREPSFAAFVFSPTIDEDAREVSIEKLFRGRASDLLVDSLQILNRKGRMALLPAVIEAYRLDHEELRDQIDVHVRTAHPLTDAQRATIKEIASRHAGKEAILVEEIDEEVIGGLILQIGDRKFDCSIASELRQLSGALSERASREIHSRKIYAAESA